MWWQLKCILCILVQRQQGISYVALFVGTSTVPLYLLRYMTWCSCEKCVRWITSHFLYCSVSPSIVLGGFYASVSDVSCLRRKLTYTWRYTTTTPTFSLVSVTRPVSFTWLNSLSCMSLPTSCRHRYSQCCSPEGVFLCRVRDEAGGIQPQS